MTFLNNTFMKVNYYNLSILDFFKIFSKISRGKSLMRINHEMFLKKITLKGNIANIGAGTNYQDFCKLFKSFKGKIIHYDFFKLHEDIIKINLEKKFKLKDNKFDVIILFNVLEHIKNYKTLLTSLKVSTVKGKRLEIFVPFMFRYHKDPFDFFRPTHFYLNQILLDSGFKNRITLIGDGPAYVILEIIFRHLKFATIKFIFFIIFYFFDKILKFFLKDYFNYYCGFHISCKKI